LDDGVPLFFSYTRTTIARVDMDDFDPNKNCVIATLKTNDNHNSTMPWLQMAILQLRPALSHYQIHLDQNVTHNQPGARLCLDESESPCDESPG
jgi:hypothetical protein